jgi:hypothetical protein
MSNGRIFLIGQQESDWIPMVETPYDQEEILQRALAQYPDLLPGDQINPESPRRWLLVRRELGVPGTADGGNIEAFWKKVETNLRQGRIRLLFVADAIPRELRRLVEFLNAKMADVEVLAVEVKQFLGHGQKAMVPRVIGLTEAARENKPGRTTPIYTRATFLDNCSPEAVPFINYVLDKTVEEGHTIGWRQSCFVARLFSPRDSREVSFVYVYPSGELQFYTVYLQQNLPKINLDELWRALLDTKLFHNTAKHTLSATVTAENHPQLRQAYDLILSHIKKLTNHTEQETES